ncbi:hypothetical protein FRX31_007271 [Thalictrum thalictroides]|uniref:Uncharacterized protein n=1 Tax=Thalictrum thalictroides TaxID=46969 RepID=A0A7J6X0D7_THATH|nr:hypothetical protein FRX31_007271 [Thalictrum thalictroides]
MLSSTTRNTSYSFDGRLGFIISLTSCSLLNCQCHRSTSCMRCNIPICLKRQTPFQICRSCDGVLYGNLERLYKHMESVVKTLELISSQI